ncbi:FxsA family protein [Bartonella tamiae]|uniref:FxsA cytoplasmic membrane protein n=1 Tax=Bartonella tamiae Th239 TaxID=1094558 RepID=J0R683_9HYPH|nr:FxsA family protein [Bartonella tamiae]EJF91219.1 hypothetical protein ME5_00551 [Bartonella tamiae Th239]EJF93116.1 hypothetical protein MEG_01330 [Bartonella tamiae Th307]
MKHIYRVKPGFAGLLFFAALFIEIAGFIIVGRKIGVLATLGLIILSMFVGCILLRIQGLTLLTRLQNELAAGHMPNRTIGNGAFVIIGAILLIIPGFVSDIFGILLFIPPIRHLIWHFITKKIQVKTTYHGDIKQDDETIINLHDDEYHRSDPNKSPWRQDDDNRRLP